MKVLIPFVLLFSCAAAAAQGAYSDAHELEKHCDTFGSMASAEYGIRHLLLGSKHGPDEAWAREKEAKARDTLTGENLKIRLFGIDYVNRRARSENDAYMATWAYCQDMFREPKPKRSLKGK